MSSKTQESMVAQ